MQSAGLHARLFLRWAGCTGKRSRTELVKLDSFDERQLLSDIRLLEEIKREHDAAIRREPEQAPYKLPMHLQELVQEVEPTPLSPGGP